ncbi:hypothetical protein B0H19DRAFT_1157854 [Mycena capillaripes]|nr:hypothetical protein B0H19DRAFT_1157854 [Mycena capillaripes]
MLLRPMAFFRQYATARSAMRQVGKGRPSRRPPAKPEEPIVDVDPWKHYLKGRQEGFSAGLELMLKDNSRQFTEHLKETVKHNKWATNLEHDLGAALVESVRDKGKLNPLTALEVIADTYRARSPEHPWKDSKQQILSRIVAGEFDRANTYAAARAETIEDFKASSNGENNLLDDSKFAPALIDGAVTTLHQTLGRIPDHYRDSGSNLNVLRMREGSETEIQKIKEGRYHELEPQGELSDWEDEMMDRSGLRREDILAICTVTRVEAMALCTLIRFACSCNSLWLVKYYAANGKVLSISF